MAYVDISDIPTVSTTDKATSILKKYKEAQNVKDHSKKHMSIVSLIASLFMMNLQVKEEPIKYLMKPLLLEYKSSLQDSKQESHPHLQDGQTFKLDLKFHQNNETQ